MKKKILVFLSVALISACSSTPKGPTKQNMHEVFFSHWKESYSQVQIIQVVEVETDFVRGNGIVNGRPIEEFYNSKTGEFSTNYPVVDRQPVVDNTKEDYRELVIAMTKELAAKTPTGARVAVFDFPALDKKLTMLSKDIAAKIETGYIDEGLDVVDRNEIEKIFAEQKLQQKEGALFDAGNVAKLGKFLGANFVVTGQYSLVQPHKLIINAKVISVETTRVIVHKEKQVPLTGPGAENKELIDALVAVPLKDMPTNSADQNNQDQKETE